MWERYGFYVVQTLLALYLALHYKWEDARVYPLVGSFTALTYISPVIGGWIADNLLGQKKAVLCGALILCLSYLLLGFLHSPKALYCMLSGIAVGTGLLKPNISSLLGNGYPEGDPNRERGFTIFYMGITSGIILGTTLPSYINTLFGWSTTYLSAAIGMVIAFSVFLYGIKRYKIADYHPIALDTDKVIYSIGLIFFLWLGSFYILRDPILASGVFTCVVLLSLGLMLTSIWQDNPKQALRTMIIGLLCIISVMFWAFYFQMFLSLTLFLKRVVQPTIFGISFPPPFYVAIESLGIILFGIFLSQKQNQLSLAHRAMRIANKFFFAMVFMCLAYLIIIVACHVTTDDSLLSPLYFIPAYLLISVAELLLSPVGLAAITLLSNHKKVSTMMGIFFVSLGVGGFLAGKLAALTSIPQDENNTLAIPILKAMYAHSFKELFYILLLCTFVSLVLNRIIKKLLVKSLQSSELM
jgi:POT family proton-dependent oligopeptide transporter